MIRPGRFRVSWLIGLFVMASAASVAAGPEDAAQAAADSWLRLVDGGDYSGSWNQAAKAFKGSVKQAEWSTLAEGARAPLGKLVSRRVKSREYTEKAPTTRVVGGRAYTWGNGKYVILEYDAAFTNKPSAAETVTAMMDPDGTWRVAGYTVR